MTVFVAQAIGRSTRRLPLVAGLLVAAHCLAEAAAAQSDPTAAVPATTPSAAQTVAEPTVNPARRKDCQQFVATLSSGGTSKQLDNAEFRGFATSDLIMCGAVASDSDAPCKRLMSVDHGPSSACLQFRYIFHELRAHPKGRTFMFYGSDWDQCHTIIGAADCDGFQKAMRSGDAKDCAASGDLQSICRAYITLDKSLCHTQGKLETAMVAVPDAKEGEPSKMKLKDVIEAECQRNIESKGFLAQGLKAQTESGPPLNRALAKAALGEKDPCASLAQPVMDACLSAGANAPLSTTPASTPRPAPQEP